MPPRLEAGRLTSRKGDEKGSDRVSIPVAELLRLTARLVEAEKEASVAPALRESVEALKTALEAERQLKGELRREVERLSRPWWRFMTRGGVSAGRAKGAVSDRRNYGNVLVTPVRAGVRFA